ALQERLRPNHRIGVGACREHLIELCPCLLEATRGGGVRRQLNPDALDRRGGDRKGERLPIGGYRVFHPLLFRVDGRKRPQSGHASAAIERHRANRERALKELAGTIAVAQRVIVHTNAVETLRLITRRLSLLCERKRAIIKTQRLVEVAEGVGGN